MLGERLKAQESRLEELRQHEGSRDEIHHLLQQANKDMVGDHEMCKVHIFSVIIGCVCYNSIANCNCTKLTTMWLDVIHISL